MENLYKKNDFPSFENCLIMLKINLLSLVFIPLCLVTIKLSAQDCADKVTAKSVEQPDTLTAQMVYPQAIHKLVNDPVLRFGQIGIKIVDVLSGETLAEHNPDMSLIPASNMKIVSTAAGLGILGPDFQFRTELQYDGNIVDSILYGNIYIKGFGDPTLASPLMDSIPNMSIVLDSFSNEIQRLGIKRIVGKIVGDGTAFESSTAVQTWQWEDIGNAYGAGPSGLNFHENLYDLSFQQNTEEGMPPSVSNIEPYIPDFQLINEVTSIRKGSDESIIYATPYSTLGYIRGTIPTGIGKMTINGSLPDPPLFAAWHLRKTLIAKGIDVTDSATTQMVLDQKNSIPLFRNRFFTWLSPRLSDIVKKANTESVNLYCEAIVRAIGLQQSGIGSNEEGIKSIKIGRAHV